MKQTGTIPTDYMTEVLSLLRKGDPVRATYMGSCSTGTFNKVYEDKAGNTVVEYFCKRSQHAHGVIPARITSLIPKSKLKARAKEDAKLAKMAARKAAKHS